MLFYFLDKSFAQELNYKDSMQFRYTHLDKYGRIIAQAYVKDGQIYIFNCPLCGGIDVSNSRGTAFVLYKDWNKCRIFSCKDDILHNVWQPLAGDKKEMARAYLTYVLLNEQSGEGAYKIKLEGHFKSQIKPFVDFIKSVVPSSDRTYDPNTYEWHYHEKYDDIIRKALEGAGFFIEDVVTKEQYADLKRKQDEFQQQQQMPQSTEMIPVEVDLKAFESLLVSAGIKWNNPPTEWNKEIASKAYKKAILFYHPDLHPEREEQSYQLNSVWRRLQEGYYIK